LTGSFDVLLLVERQWREHKLAEVVQATNHLFDVLQKDDMW